MNDRIKELDKLVYRAERAFVVGALVVMSIVVFLDVVHRTFSSEDNKFVEALVKLLSFIVTDIERDSASWNSLESIAPYLLWVGFSALGYFGIRTATRKDPMPQVKALGFSVVGVVAVYGLIRLFLRMFPNGLIWSQPLALVLTLWVGFIGASMCTYENKHLKVEAAQRFIPEKYKHIVAFASAVFTTVVCVALLWLSLRYVTFTYDEYVGTEGQGGLFQGLEVPKYICFAALPVSFAIMSARFAVLAVRALGGELPASDPLEGLLEEVPHAGMKPSDVPTEVSGRRRPSSKDGEALPSEVPTEAVKISDDDLPPGDKPKPKLEVAERPKEAAGPLGGSEDDGDEAAEEEDP